MSEHEKLEKNLNDIDAYFMEHYGSKDSAIHSYVAIFPQVWATTALGFGRFGGNSITTKSTIIVQDIADYLVVFFDGEFAYKIKNDEKAAEYIRNRRMPYVNDAEKLLTVIES